MKHNLITYTMTAMLGIALTACNEKPAPEQSQEPFQIEVYDITSVMATVEVEPLDKAAAYYMDILSESDFTQTQEYGFDDYMTYLVEKLMNEQDKGRKEVVEMISSYGNDGFIVTTLTPETKYYAVAVGIDEDGKTTTEVVYQEFSTTEVRKSENTLKVSASEIGTSSATINVDASNKDPYILAIEPYTVTEGLSDAEIAEFIIKDNMAWGGIEQMICTGDISEKFEGKPGWEYEAIVFGYADGLTTTDVTRVKFSMDEGAAPESCTFGYAQEFGEFEMYLSVKPSDNSVVYVSNVIAASDLAALTAAEGNVNAALTANLEFLIEEIIADCGSRARAIDIITMTGELDYSLKFKNSTDYVMWAVPVTQDGIPAAEFSYSEAFTTPAETLSDASLTLKSHAYYNGSELAEMYPDIFASAKGYAVVDMTVEASETAVSWWSYVALEDLTDRSRETIIKNLISAPTEANLTRQLVLAYWGTNTIMGVAQDADGKYGELLLQVVDLTKENAAPASELVLPE